MSFQKVWSEDLKGAHMTGVDMMHGLGLEQMHEVMDDVTRFGVVCVGNCRRCGRQWKMVCSWGEIQAFYLGQGVKGTVPTRQGVIIKVGCPGCRRVTPVMCGWDEVGRYVHHGVRSGSLDEQILKARAY